MRHLYAVQAILIRCRRFDRSNAKLMIHYEYLDSQNKHALLCLRKKAKKEKREYVHIYV